MSEPSVTAYIGVGSNIEPEKNIAYALDQLAQYGAIVNHSMMYWTKPLAGNRPAGLYKRSFAT